MVSIIIPMHNSEKCVEACILSVLRQTFTDIELILVNNMSTDGTAEIAQKYAQNHAHITYFYCGEKGVSNARNVGLRSVRGEFVFFLDADDTLAPNAIEVLHGMAVKHNLDIAACNILRVSANKSVLMERSQLDTIAPKGDIPQLFEQMLPSYLWYMVFKLFRRSALAGFEFLPSLTVGEDLAFVINALENASTVGFSAMPLYNYNTTSDGLNLKYHQNLYDMKCALYSKIKLYLEKYGMPLDNLHKNLTNDIFALIVNEQKSAAPDFDRIFNSDLAKEFVQNCGAHGVKKLFYYCVKYRLKFVAKMLAITWMHMKV